MVAAYRDTFRLLLNFTTRRLNVEPSQLNVDHLDAPLIADFLDYLERDRQNSVRTRNARLAAIRSLFRYAALRHPEHAAMIERVLAIPPKTLRAKARRLPGGAGSRRAPRRPQPENVDGPTGPRAARACAANGVASLGADGASVRRRSSRCRSSYPLPGQGKETPHHTAHEEHGRCNPGLARRANRSSDRTTTNGARWRRSSNFNSR